MTRRDFGFMLAAALIGVSWLQGSAPDPPTIEGVVTAVHDGDTITVKVGSAFWKVRLSDIDAPEMAMAGRWPEQPWAKEAQQALAVLVEGQTVTLAVQPQPDEHGRHVARVFHSGIDVNLRLVQAGAAWRYPAYNHGKINIAAMKAAQSSAQTAKRGLWSLPDPIPPWEWRRTAADGV